MSLSKAYHNLEGKMKYLKITMVLFVIMLCLGTIGVNATQYTQLIDITIPVFSGVFVSKQVDKGNDFLYTQKVKKTAIQDDLSGDGRAVKGSIRGYYSGTFEPTGWIDLPLNSIVDFGEGTISQGAWQLQLQSTKWLPTTATASFDWDLGTIDYSPYPVVGW